MEFYNNSIFWIDIDKIKPNPFQPRREFDEARLKDLASSIRQYGILQPLVVTRREVFREDGSMFVEYELISGERRLRASKIAGLPQVPAIIRTGDQTDRVKLELAIIENLQREDLNPIDRAKSFKQLVDTFNLKHTEIAEKIGKSREYVSNSLRLLQMPEEMQNALVEGKISEGHTRPIMMLNGRPEEQMVLFREIMQRRMTVREAEGIARRIAYDKVRKKEYIFSPDIIEMESKLTEALGTRVQIEALTAGGKIHIDYFSEKDLRNILDFIKKSFDGKVSVSSDVQTAPQVVEDMTTSGDIVSPVLGSTNTEAVPNIPASGEIGIAGYDVAPLAHLMDTDVSTEEQRVLQDDMPKEDKKDDEELYDMNNFTV
jgi:ParB family transcriptional regulator, chromosome partitioning protein